MNCENCLHYGVCKVHYSLGMLALIDGNCSNYDDRTEWLRLPCKVGDICWLIANNGIIKTAVEKIVAKEKGLYLKLSCNSLYETTCRSIGKNVFFTYGEAEKALKERDNNA